MRRSLALAAITGLIVVAACSDNTRQIPTEPGVQFDKGVPCPGTTFPLTQAKTQITALYPAGALRNNALATATDIAKRWSQCKVADPQSKVVAFVKTLLSDFRAGRLIVYSTPPTTATRVSALINTMYSGVGFGTPNLPVDQSTGTDFGIGFFTPGTPLLVRTNLNDAAASLPGNAFTETTAITVLLRPTTPNPFDGTGHTVLPPFFEITASNLSGTHYLANGRAVVGFCVDEETVLNELNEPAIAHIAVAEGAHPGGFELLDDASDAQYAALGLNCEQFVPLEIGSLFDGGLKGFASAAPRVAARYARAAAAAFLPHRLEAAVGKKGLGGLPSSLSSFGVGNRSPDSEGSEFTARQQLGADTISGNLYAVGGLDQSSNLLATVEAYDPNSDTWSTRTSMPGVRYALSVVALSGSLYAVGGRTAPSGAVATVEAYDPGSNSWTAKAPMPTARHSLGVAVINGILYAVGGADNTGARVATVEAYDPGTNTWTTKAPMPTARHSLAVAALNGTLYAIGGASGSTNDETKVEAYDPGSNTWTTKAPMPTGRQLLGAAAINGILYAVDGLNASSGFSGLTTVEAYDPDTDTWTTEAPMQTARLAPGVAALGGTLYAVGGASNGVLGTFEAYQP